MLLRKLWRTIGLYKAQFISMLILITLGIGVFVGSNMEWYSIENNTNAFFEETGFADYRIVSETGFSSDDLESISKITGVEKAGRFLSVDVEVKEQSGDSLSLTVTENPDVSGFLVNSGEAYDEDSTDGIWLSEKYANANGIAVGDDLTFSYGSFTIEGEVTGLIQSGEYLICLGDDTQIMPDYAVYGYAYISPTMYENAVGMEYYTQIHVISSLTKTKFVSAADSALGTTQVILTRDETASYSGASGEAEEGKTMGAILPVLFLLIAVLTMVTTMHRIAAKEKTQIGTLKALGFRNKRILIHYTSYAFVIGVVGTVLGIGLGYLIGYVIMNPNGMMGTYFDMPYWKLRLPWFCVVIMIAVVVLLTLIGYASVKAMLQGSAADALRPYAPKEMKHMAIEESRWFHNRSFGTRWNLRDILRHKSRTAMSLIGVVGCMTIMVAAFGMKDSMDAFLANDYDNAANYAACISLAEDATETERDALISEYNGDWSSTVSVQAEGEAVALEVYNLENGLVKFPSNKKGYQEIGDNGAYICRRLAKEFDVKEGDTLTVSPYGTDDSYTLTIAGVIRSVSECVVISEEYAKTLDLPYLADTVYTATAKEDIAASDAIQSVQSKETLLSSFESFMWIMNLMVAIFVLAAMVMGLVVLYNLGTLSYTERYREMATLKVVGFRDKQIGRLLVSQNLWVSVLGIVLGLPAGAGVLYWLMAALAPEYEVQVHIDVLTYLFSVLLTLAVSLSVSLMVSRKNKHINMVEALKSNE